MIVCDSSALLAYLRGEPGAEVVAERLESQAVCGAANWSEVEQQVLQARGDWSKARALLLASPVRVEPVTEADAEHAARGWRPGSGLSLADRLCLALGERLDAEVLTADTAWAGIAGVTLIR